MDTSISHGWQLIDDATPRDGRTILLTSFEDDGSLFEVHPMQWAHIQKNALFPGVTGMWTSPGGHYTWNDDGMGGGPTHWRPASDLRDALLLTQERERG